MNKLEFKKRFKRYPKDDELLRVNCKHVGTVGHFACGVCRKHNKPRFMCGCLKIKSLTKDQKKFIESGIK